MASGAFFDREKELMQISLGSTNNFSANELAILLIL